MRAVSIADQGLRYATVLGARETRPMAKVTTTWLTDYERANYARRVPSDEYVSAPFYCYVSSCKARFLSSTNFT